MAGKPPSELVAAFAADTLSMSTKELAKKYGKASSTIGEWRQYCREAGMEIGYGTGEATVKKPFLEGVSADEEDQETPIEEIWKYAIARQKKAETRVDALRSQVIELPNEPFALAMLSDTHFGSDNADYETALRDAKTVAATPGMYGLFNGDGSDNWIVGRLVGQGMNQGMTISTEMRMLFNWLEILGDSLLIVVSGNHDNWTYILTGQDHLKNALKNYRLLYDPHEVVWKMRCGPAEWLCKARHQWRGSSIFNDTHGIQVGWERGDDPFDIGIGGHTHTGTFITPFARHRKLRWAVQLGTYKKVDGYARSKGFRSTEGLGCGALVFHPNGRIQPCYDLETAADFLEFWRQ